jgi:hypothetical protein
MYHYFGCKNILLEVKGPGQFPIEKSAGRLKSSTVWESRIGRKFGLPAGTDFYGITLR